jgi:uncharacterized protein YndB with AHSA1/START domain
MPEIVMEQRFAAPPARVFEAITDHVAFGRFMGADIRVEREGTPAPNGLGALRVVRARGTAVREEVVRWEPPHAMDYRVVSGAPLRDHLGTIRIEPDGPGARVTYRIRFGWPWWGGGAFIGERIARTLEREITAGLGRMAAAVR